MRAQGRAECSLPLTCRGTSRQVIQTRHSRWYRRKRKMTTASPPPPSTHTGSTVILGQDQISESTSPAMHSWHDVLHSCTTWRGLKIKKVQYGTQDKVFTNRPQSARARNVPRLGQLTGGGGGSPDPHVTSHPSAPWNAVPLDATEGDARPTCRVQGFREGADLRLPDLLLAHIRHAPGPPTVARMTQAPPLVPSSRTLDASRLGRRHVVHPEVRLVPAAQHLCEDETKKEESR